jgi:methyl-accepting chemotaxis protein
VSSSTPESGRHRCAARRRSPTSYSNLSAFEDIDAAVERVAEGIAEVSRATDDQAVAVDELQKRVRQLRT